MHLSRIPIFDTTRNDLREVIRQRSSQHQKSILFFANTNFVVKLQPFVEKLARDEVLIVNDGIGVDIASYLTNGKKFKDNLNGTDFVPFYFEGARPHKLFLLGSTQPDLEKAAHLLTAKYGQQVVGYSDGFHGVKDPELIDKINASGAEIVLVGMGNPLQERWILEHYQSLHAHIFMGVGALFLFMAGNIPRAPGWVRKSRLEWLFRLLLEPRRLFKRYTIDVVYFLYLCLKHKDRSSKGT